MGYKHTYDTIYTHFQGIYNNIYDFGRPFFSPSFFTRPPIFLPVHIRFYPSKWWVDGSLHKAMVHLDLCELCMKGFREDRNNGWSFWLFNVYPIIIYKLLLVST